VGKWAAREILLFPLMDRRAHRKLTGGDEPRGEKERSLAGDSQARGPTSPEKVTGENPGAGGEQNGKGIL